MQSGTSKESKRLQLFVSPNFPKAHAIMETTIPFQSFHEQQQLPLPGREWGNTKKLPLNPTFQIAPPF